MANYIEGTSVLTNEQQDVPCAWHERDKDPRGTHKICDDCVEKVITSFYREKLNKVPSYVERFRDGREKF